MRVKVDRGVGRGRIRTGVLVRERGEQRVRPEIWIELAEAGFHGLLVPEEYDSAGMEMQEMGLTIETLCAESCGMAGTWYLVLTGHGRRRHPRERTEAQKETYLLAIANGERNFFIGITEPKAGRTR